MPYVVGETYRVPCIKIKNKQGQLDIIPVYGASHADPDLGNFSIHFHIQDIFLTDEELVRYGFLRDDGYQAIPTINLGVHFVPELFENLICRRQYNVGFPQNKARRSHLPLMEATRTRLRTEAFRLKLNCKVCPHRGTCLDNVSPDSEGIIQCPAHGLAFDVSTGEIL